MVKPLFHSIQCNNIDRNNNINSLWSEKYERMKHKVKIASSATNTKKRQENQIFLFSKFSTVFYPFQEFQCFASNFLICFIWLQFLIPFSFSQLVFFFFWLCYSFLLQFQLCSFHIYFFSLAAFDEKINNFHLIKVESLFHEGFSYHYCGRWL